ncbi:MAG: TorF family putative porin [Sphingomonadaceae bacterium]
MRILVGCTASLLGLLAANSALAQESDPPLAITINGTATLVSDYRFRGISQTDKKFAVQGSLTITHESGLYASVWGSSVDSYVTAASDLYAGGNGTSCCVARQEIDLIVGFKKTLGSATVDVGVLYYVYPKTKAPGDATSSDFIEPYVAISGTVGPLSAKATVNYAPKQKALALDQIGPKQDNVYVAGDFSVAIPNTPVSLTAHIGHSFGPSWLSTTDGGLKDEYTDWALGASVTFKALTLGVQYVDTDTRFFVPSGKDAAKAGIVATLGVSF